MGYTPHVVVIGGGSTGTGVARDLAMRGLEVTLVDRGTLASGTSGAMHAVLHSGARYAVDDPTTAAACRRENRVLREIAAPYVAETGGLFAARPEDPTEYVDEAIAACEDVGIETTPLDGEALREREPTLSPDVESGFAVPDAVVDPFQLCAATARSASRYGADIRAHTRVVDLTVTDGAVESLLLRSTPPDEPATGASNLESLPADFVVNAAGPWADEVAGYADLSAPVRPTQGAMVAMDRAGLGTVVNRCRPRSQGDIAVPFGSSAILGTTESEVEGPDAVDRNPEAIDFLLSELGDLVPDVAAADPRRVYWGVRALAADGGDGPDVNGGDGTDTDPGHTTEADRLWTLVDHETSDGVWGLLTVFGGKLTTHRRIAESVADAVCAKFGIDRPCRTADIALPEPVAPAAESPDPVLCPCEGVTRSAVRAVLEDADLPTGQSLRPVVARTRAAMGACQGGRCAHRLAAELSPAATDHVVGEELDALYRRRWRGRRPVLWGGNAATAAEAYERHETLMRGETEHRRSSNPIKWDRFDAGPSEGEEA